MRAKYFIWLLVIGIVFCSPGCKKKYEDGPFFSLRSKGERLEGTWRAVYQRENGREFLNDHTITLEATGKKSEPSGEYFMYTLYTSDGSGAEQTIEGSWALSGDKEEIYFRNDTYSYNPNDGSGWETGYWKFTDAYEIRRLTNKELWLEVETPTYKLSLEFEKE